MTRSKKFCVAVGDSEFDARAAARAGYFGRTQSTQKSCSDALPSTAFRVPCASRAARRSGTRRLQRLKHPSLISAPHCDARQCKSRKDIRHYRFSALKWLSLLIYPLLLPRRVPQGLSGISGKLSEPSNGGRVLSAPKGPRNAGDLSAGQAGHRSTGFGYFSRKTRFAGSEPERRSRAVRPKNTDVFRKSTPPARRPAHLIHHRQRRHKLSLITGYDENHHWV